MQVPDFFLHFRGFGFSTLIAGSFLVGSLLAGSLLAGSFLAFFFGGFDAPRPGLRDLDWEARVLTREVAFKLSFLFLFLVVFLIPVSSKSSVVEVEEWPANVGEGEPGADGGTEGEPGADGGTGAFVLGGDFSRQFPRPFGLPLFLFWPRGTDLTWEVTSSLPSL